jgi:hypothetical protein
MQLRDEIPSSTEDEDMTSTTKALANTSLDSNTNGKRRTHRHSRQLSNDHKNGM